MRMTKRESPVRSSHANATSSTSTRRTAQAVPSRRGPDALVPVLARAGILSQRAGRCRFLLAALPKPYSIVIPPPNVTGALHLGHALNNTLQDMLIRWKRMQGFNTLWMPGTDHAGIATQAVVERRLLEEEKKTRHDLGRAKLVERIWAWKNEYEARILGQLKQMGCSCDWQRTRFTLDPHLRPGRPPHVFQNVSRRPDLSRQAAGQLGHVPANGRQRRRSFSRNRRRPLLALPLSGDRSAAGRADARHDRHHPARDDAGRHGRGRPSRSGRSARSGRKGIESQAGRSGRKRCSGNQDADRRHRHPPPRLLPGLVKLAAMARAGRRLLLPLLDREIPLVADEWAKPELGSGCVKITPAHDPNDYEVGRRQSLPMINILNPDGTLNDNAGKYRGLKIMDARQRVVADLEALGLVEAIEDREIELAHSDRSKTPIEPYLADQWFVRMQDLAQSAMDAVSGRPGENLSVALRQGLSRLAGRKTRLARQPATLVGTSDSDLAPPQAARRSQRPGLGRKDHRLATGRPPGRGRRAPAAIATCWSASARKAIPTSWKPSNRTGYFDAIPTCSIPGSARPCGRIRRWAGPRKRRSWNSIIRPARW